MPEVVGVFASAGAFTLPFLRYPLVPVTIRSSADSLIHTTLGKVQTTAGYKSLFYPNDSHSWWGDPSPFDVIAINCSNT
jgi:hypothetical protein